ncbi:MAG: M67 family metallopeptidase [Alphaproteobacteria bacterium]|nr:M67 family metallopeptidase [Alphaproteobacteria bacterium]
MIRLKPDHLADIEAAAEAAYPYEACGLLVGRAVGADAIEVTRVVPSRNVAAEQEARKDRFEIDPKLRFDVMRECEGGPEDIVGHYHSHPDHPAEPSAIDLSMAYDREYVWVIAAVAAGRVARVAAHRLNRAGDAFEEIPLRVQGQEGA